MFNGLDIAIIVIFLAIIGLGFFNGVTRVTSAMLAIYFAAIVSAAFYRPASETAREHLTAMSERTGNLFFFVLLFFIFSTFFTFCLSRWLGNLKLPRRVEIADNVGGAALGIIVSGLAVTLAAMLLSITLQALHQTMSVAGSDAMAGFIEGQIENSELVPVFLRLAPFFLQMISPWFPNGLPPILSGMPQG